jgi:hypothetical protein
MAPVNAELRQNIMVTLYLLFAHNYIAFAYLAGVILAIALAFYKPSRFTTLITVGFAILLFSFEYDKHIVDGLREQTTNSLITMDPHYTLKHYIDLITTELLPVLLYVTGWACLFISMWYAAVRIDKSDYSGSFLKDLKSIVARILRRRKQLPGG